LFGALASARASLFGALASARASLFGALASARALLDALAFAYATGANAKSAVARTKARIRMVRLRNHYSTGPSVRNEIPAANRAIDVPRLSQLGSRNDAWEDAHFRNAS
jgi:hypothetical protein